MTSPHTKSVVYRVSHDGGYSSHPHLGKHLVKEEVIAEATIHSLHAIARSKTPANVRFKNGSSAMVHHGTAARVMRLHSLMRKHNKRKVEALVNSSPDGLKKVVDFVDTHLK
jgi:hypothetical protein